MSFQDILIGNVRETAANFYDKRSGKGWSAHSMQDIGMSAFSLFFMQDSSFLSFQRRLEEDQGKMSCRGLFGITTLPSDNHIRSMLDEVSPASLQASFDFQLQEFVHKKALTSFHVLGNRILVALDGTEYFTSQKIHCSCCQKRDLKSGITEHYHSMLGVSIVTPGNNKAFSLMPEFITPQDGAPKQDSEICAAKRWLKQHHSRIAELKPIYLGDDLFCHQPFAEEILAQGGDFLLICKPNSHKTLYEFMEGIPLSELVVKHKKGKKKETRRYRWFCDVPLRDGEGALHVNWLSVEIFNDAGKRTHITTLATNLPVSKENVVELSECGRARWKIENATFNVLKNNGYNLSHNFGHGKKNLSMMLVTLNLLAFNIHTLSDLCDELWERASLKLGARVRFFQRLSSIASMFICPSWESLLKTIAEGETHNDIVIANNWDKKVE